jgi:hypothetical protein
MMRQGRQTNQEYGNDEWRAMGDRPRVDPDTIYASDYELAAHDPFSWEKAREYDRWFKKEQAQRGQV